VSSTSERVLKACCAWSPIDRFEHAAWITQMVVDALQLRERRRREGLAK
jgi:hypothetical protein